MRPSLQQRAQSLHAQREAAHRLRRRRTVARRDGLRAEVDGGWLLECCGNDYLGLSRHPAVVAALRDGAMRDGAGGVASHLVSGHAAAHDALERALAEWLQAPRALLFGSGYLANLAVLQGLLGEGDACVQDRLNHASLIDGARLAGCALKRYPHADAEGAARQLAAHPDGAALLATDGVFSMDGDVAPLRALAGVAGTHGACLYVDEAHAVGVLGDAGRGSVAAAGLATDAVSLRLVTFGKALGSVGAAVVGDADLVEHLAQVARPGIYTTALPPAQAAATLAAVAIASGPEGEALRARLQANIARFRDGARARGLMLMPSDTPIQPLVVGADADALAMAAGLERRGYWVAAIRPPTVPEGSARLRITLNALHGDAEVDGLLAALDAARTEAA